MSAIKRALLIAAAAISAVIATLAFHLDCLMRGDNADAFDYFEDEL